jgi:O-methyltransferase
MQAEYLREELELNAGNNLYIDILKRCLNASIYDESAWRVLRSDHETIRPFRQPLRFLKGLMRRWLVGFLSKRSLLLVKQQPFDRAQSDEGRAWPYLGYTMVGQRRLDNVQQCVEDVLRNNIPGDFIETGVWRGGTVIFMRALLKAYGVTDRTVWVADSFEGLPPPASGTDGADLSQVEYLKVSLEEVKSNFERFGLLDQQVQFLKGWFCDTLPRCPIDRLAILRLDGDLYSSTMDSLHNLYHRVSPGGYVIVDDYYSWESCRRAIADFLKEKNLDVDIRQIDWTGAYWKVEGKQ